MTSCEFCRTSYHPRPQVKSPRACPKAACQSQRQRRNEQEWREKNSDRYTAEYFRRWRKQVHRRQRQLLLKLMNCLEIGRQFLALDELNLAGLQALLATLIYGLSAGQINKL